MYIVTFTAHQQRNMVRTPPHFFGAGDAPAPQGIPEPSSLRCSTSVPEQLNMKAVPGA